MPTITRNPAASDGYIVGRSGVSFGAARLTSTLTGDGVSTMRVGSLHSIAQGWDVNRAALPFDTDLAGGTAISATLRVYMSAKAITANNSTVAVIPITSLAFPLSSDREANYDEILAAAGATIGNIITTATDAAGAYYEIEVPVEHIVEDGTTVFALLWGRDISNNGPTSNQNEYVTLETSEGTHKPELVIVYSSAPIEDDGSEDDEEAEQMLLAAA